MSGLPGFDAVNRQLDAAVVIAVVTTPTGDRSGCLVGFHSQVGIEPLRYCVWISRENHTFGLLADASELSVHPLTDADREVATLFATRSGDDIDKWETMAHAGLALPEAHVSGPIVDLLDHPDLDHVGVVLAPSHAHAAGGTDAADGSDGDTTNGSTLRVSDVSDLAAGHEVD
ncbi:MAG: flavin reductase family protein [Microthrixaceae bacterium]|nr:flavin reductase [Microthrixaceae bacterium]MCO5313240.1 flavin reductase family protein [Microthrixaceae bacterium]HPB44722.1 flavin reductase [Microthrixaceae bacterium]